MYFLTMVKLILVGRAKIVNGPAEKLFLWNVWLS